MKMIESNIIDCLPETPTTEFDFSGVYTDSEGHSHNLTIFDTSYFLMNLYQLHTSRKIMVNEDNPSAHLVNLFSAWKNSRKELFLKQAYAYTLKYNPIENYSSVEKMIDDVTEHAKGTTTTTTFDNDDKLTITPFSKETTEKIPFTKETTETIPFTKETTETIPFTKETTETIPYTKETTETTPTDTNTSSIMAFNSNDWAATDKKENGGKVTEELTKTGTEKVELTKTGTEKIELSKTGTEKVELTKTGTEKVELTKTGNEIHTTEHDGTVEVTGEGSDTDTRNYTLTKAGNIGVMTPAEMLQKEFDALTQDLAYRAFNEFIDRFTYYAEGVR